jgi:subtilisin family serine protease
MVCSQNQGIEINDESELSSVIGVGASSEFNDVTSYSNYGKHIDILAPGGDTIQSSGLLGLNDTGINGRTNQRALVNSSYSFTNGTSFSAPITTGVIALMLSVNPTITPDQIREILIQTSDKIGRRSNYIDGFDKYRAYGKINATKAVLMAKDYKN